MATISAARSLFRSSPLTRSAASRIASQTKSPARSPLLTKPPLSRRTIRCLPEMSFCVESMLPYHTATASALMNSMLSVSQHSYGWLSNASNDDV